MPLPEQCSLLDLPESVLSAIAKHGFSKRAGHPLLAVARSLRDAVLVSLSKIKLDLAYAQSPEGHHYGAQGRLLHRACCKAPPGLNVELNLWGKQDALPQLLQPALKCGGWHNVHRLKVVTKSKEFTNLLGPALPALRHVTVDLMKGDVGDGGLFTGLLLCKQLSTLHLVWFSISPAAVEPAAAALAQLTALRDVLLWTSADCEVNPADLVEQLTCLTALGLYVQDGEAKEYSVQSTFTAAARNPGLQAFKAYPGWSTRPTAAELQHLLEACPALSELELTWMTLSPDAVESLLTHGTNVTTLTAEVLETTASLADKPCSWKTLELQGEDYPTVLHLANLPLKGLSSLQLAMQWATDLATLQLPLATVAAEDLPHLLQRAATNLAACPAWKAQPSSHIRLWGDPSVSDTEDAIEFSPQQRIQLLEALAPLGGTHVSSFAGCIKDAEFEWGRAEVEAMARSLGGKEITRLELSHCTLATDFWAALDEFLPSLKTLRLQKDVKCPALDLAIFCTKRGQCPFTLELAQPIYIEVGGAQLAGSLRAQGVPHVTCTCVW